MRGMRPVMSAVTSGRLPVEPTPESPGGRPAPPPNPATELAALAALLADIVQLAGQRAVYPGYWEQIAEQAMEHPSVRAAPATAARDGS